MMSMCASPGSFTDFAEINVLNVILGIDGWSSPQTLKAALCTSVSEDGTFTEINKQGYERKIITFLDPVTNASGESSVENKYMLVFGPALEDWGDQIRFLAIFAGDDLITWGPLGGNWIVFQDQELIVTTGEVQAVLTASFAAGRWSKYLQEQVLKHVFLKTEFASPSIHAALCDVYPSFDDTGSDLSEPADAAYSRPLVTGWGAPETVATGKQSEVNPCAPFGTATSDWGQMSVVAFVDASSGGNLLFYGHTSIDQEVFAGDSVALGESNCGAD